MSFVPARAFERVPVQSNDGRAKRWRPDRIHRPAARQAVSSATHGEGVVSGGAADGGLPRGRTRTGHGGGHRCNSWLWRVGLGAVAASSARGARTICIDVDDKKLELARAAGAACTINSVREPLHESLQEMTGGSGPDVFIEAVGTPATFRAAVEEVAFTGTVVYIGYAKEPVSYETRLFVQKELDIRGSRNAEPADFRAVIKLLETKKFPVDQAVSCVVPLEEAPNALRSWSENPARFQKIMVSLG